MGNAEHETQYRECEKPAQTLAEAVAAQHDAFGPDVVGRRDSRCVKLSLRPGLAMRPRRFSPLFAPSQFVEQGSECMTA